MTRSRLLCEPVSTNLGQRLYALPMYVSLAKCALSPTLCVCVCVSCLCVSLCLCHFHSLTHSLTHSLAPSLPPSLPPLTHSLTPSLTHSLTHSLTRSLTHSLTDVANHLLTTERHQKTVILMKVTLTGFAYSGLQRSTQLKCSQGHCCVLSSTHSFTTHPCFIVAHRTIVVILEMALWLSARYSPAHTKEVADASRRKSQCLYVCVRRANWLLSAAATLFIHSYVRLLH